MKVAIYGGSFDPIHLEHKNIIKACKKELGVDKVILLPTYLPPHKKKSKTSYEDRVNMINLMIEDLDYVEIDNYELTTNTDVNYAYNMLHKLKNKYPDFVYVIGGDSLKNIESWYKFDELLHDFSICVIKRDNVVFDYQYKINELKKKYNADITLLEYVGKDISSTYITISNYLYQDITQFVGKPVSTYIKEHKLYMNYDHFVSKIKSSVSERLFNHIVNTVLCGIKINQYCNLNISTTRVFVACVLHDIAKERKDLIYGVPPITVNTEIFHQFYGERVALYEYNITDEMVLDAIRFHTTAKPEMTDLGKLVFLADKICKGRTHDGVIEIREDLRINGFDSAFVKCLNWSYDYLISKGKSVYPLTKEAVDYYNKENV